MRDNFYRIILIYNCMKEKHVCIYGCGSNGRYVAEVLKKHGFIIEAVCDKYNGHVLDGCMSVSIEQLEQLDRKVVCIVTPEENAEDEFNRLQEHFDIVIDIKQFREIRLEYYVPPVDADWGWECYAPLNNYESPYITPESIEYKLYLNIGTDAPKGITLREDEQIRMLHELDCFYRAFYKDIKENPESMRWKDRNGYFDECDAALLYSMFLKYKPERYVEIGSGYSTAIALDARDKYFKDRLKISCIEPYPERLIKNLRQKNEVKINVEYVQETDMDIFDGLESGDVLFIDSSHVAKPGGDVLFEYFEILPRLKEGVIIHIHDIFYPFIYPEKWIKQGRCYNEAFIVRALLMDNDKYEILFFNDMMAKLYGKEYGKICHCPGGSSLWLRKK